MPQRGPHRELCPIVLLKSNLILQLRVISLALTWRSLEWAIASLFTWHLQGPHRLKPQKLKWNQAMAYPRKGTGPLAIDLVSIILKIGISTKRYRTYLKNSYEKTFTDGWQWARNKCLNFKRNMEKIFWRNLKKFQAPPKLSLTKLFTMKK